MTATDLAPIPSNAVTPPYSAAEMALGNVLILSTIIDYFSPPISGETSNPARICIAGISKYINDIAAPKIFPRILKVPYSFRYLMSSTFRESIGRCVGNEPDRQLTLQLAYPAHLAPIEPTTLDVVHCFSNEVCVDPLAISLMGQVRRVTVLEVAGIKTVKKFADLLVTASAINLETLIFADFPQLLSLRPTATFEKVRHLTLKAVESFDLRDLQFFPNLHKLELITVRSLAGKGGAEPAPTVAEPGDAEIQMPRKLETVELIDHVCSLRVFAKFTLTSVRQLVLRGDDEDFGISLASLGDAFPLLEHIDLYSHDRVELSHVRAVQETLRSVRINADLFMSSFPQNLPNIETLLIYARDGVQDVDLHSTLLSTVAGAYSKVTHLLLQDILPVRNILYLPALQRLTKLEICTQHEIEIPMDFQILQMLAGLPELAYLDIRTVSCEHEIAAATIFQHSHKLETLIVNGTRISLRL